MTKQEFIIKTLKGYIEDPDTCAHVPGVSANGCMYRTNDGRKCAVGQHIRDDAYDPSMEKMDANDLFHYYGMQILTDDAQEIDMDPNEYYYMQNVHDEIAEFGVKYQLTDSIETLEENTETDLTELKDLVEKNK